MHKKVFIICMVLLVAVLIILPISLNIEKKNVSTNIGELQGKNDNNNQNEDNKPVKSIDELKIEEEKNDSMHKSAMFHKMNNYIVYVNDFDKSIYVFDISQGTGLKIATIDEGINKMYFDGEYIYVMPSYYRGKGIYKIDLQGNISKIYDEACLQLWIEEDKIYFVIQEGYDEINNNPQGTIAVMDKDGKNIVELIPNIKNYFYIQGDYIYYTTQSKELYKTKKDGIEKELLTVGRKYTTTIMDGYLTYIDYGDGESRHLLNLNTKEDNEVGRFGQESIYLGDLYMATRADKYGILDNDYTLFKLDNGKLQSKDIINQLQNSILKYIYNGKIYLSNQDKGTFTVDVESKQEESNDVLKDCNYFIGANAYSIKSIEGVIQPIKIVNLDNLEETIIEIQE